MELNVHKIIKITEVVFLIISQNKNIYTQAKHSYWDMTVFLRDIFDFVYDELMRGKMKGD